MRDKVKIKNKSCKKEKGITLVALVITIIILIILATVAINFAFGQNGIISQAEKGRDYYSNDHTYTDDSLANVDAYLGYLTQKWKYDESGNITDGKVTLKIGDYINYDCTTNDETYTSLGTANGYGDQIFTASEYSYGWRVLGVDEGTGELLILSEDFVPLTGGASTANRTYYYLSGQEGYANGINELNKICEIYGKGEGATGGRSITIDDINKITGYNPNNVGVYDPEQTGTGTKAGEGTIVEYGNKITYYWDGTEFPYCEGSNGVTGSMTESHNNGFAWYDSSSGWQLSPNSNISAREEITTIENNYYLYYPNTLTDSSEGDTVGISTDSQAYKMLFTNSSTGAYPTEVNTHNNMLYWLGSSVNWISSGEREHVCFGIVYVYSGRVSGGGALYNSNGAVTHDDYYRGVRPVVSLNSEITLTDSGTERDGCTLWNIG